jgi:diacylglycerol kinase (ATP)
MKPDGATTQFREFGDKLSQRVLVNPNAGSGKTVRMSTAWKSRLVAPYQILTSSSREDIEQIAARAAADHVPRFIIVGGDGTIHHALNGYLSVPNSPTRLAIVPCGTANDYGQSLQSHCHEKGQCNIDVDVGVISCGQFQRYFFNVAGIGLTAHAALASRPAPWLPARARYSLGLFRALWSSWRHVNTHIQMPNSEPIQKDVLTLSVAIGKREGSFTLAPKARIDDGIFELLIASHLRRLDVCRYLPGLMVGKLPTNDPRIQSISAEHLCLRSQAPLNFHLDGEIYGDGTLPSNVEIRFSTPIKLRVELLS